MSSDHGQEHERIEREVLDHSASFSFDQVVRLLGSRPSGEGETEQDGEGRALRIRPSLVRELPGAEVVAVTASEEAYEIQTTFLGLYGASSPLPSFYTEELIEAAQEDRTGAQALLDLVHQHLFELYIEARCKRRPLQATVEGGEQGFTGVLRSLIGMLDGRVRGALRDPDRMLRYIPLLAPRQRSAEGLRTLLADALGGIPVVVEQCVQRRVRVPAASRLRLGKQANALGHSAVLGARVTDRIGRFRIQIGPLSGDAFNELVNRGMRWQWLVGAIRLYLSSSIQCELDVLLEDGAGETVVLGDESRGRLGTTTWLFSGQPHGLRADLQLD